MECGVLLEELSRWCGRLLAAGAGIFNFEVHIRLIMSGILFKYRAVSCRQQEESSNMSGIRRRGHSSAPACMR
jgi:hypothetical protein